METIRLFKHTYDKILNEVLTKPKERKPSGPSNCVLTFFLSGEILSEMNEICASLKAKSNEFGNDLNSWLENYVLNNDSL